MLHFLNSYCLLQSRQQTLKTPSLLQARSNVLCIVLSSKIKCSLSFLLKVNEGVMCRPTSQTVDACHIGWWACGCIVNIIQLSLCLHQLFASIVIVFRCLTLSCEYTFAILWELWTHIFVEKNVLLYIWCMLLNGHLVLMCHLCRCSFALCFGACTYKGICNVCWGGLSQQGHPPSPI